MQKLEAVKKAIEICKNEGTLKEYLEKREAEVVTIMRTLFDQEYAMEIHDYNLKKELTEKAEQEKQAAIVENTANNVMNFAEALNISVDVAIKAVVKDNDELAQKVKEYIKNVLKNKMI